MSQFIISLDYELLWGLRDIHDKKTYGKAVIGARVAIPKMLDLFEKYGIGATWSTVGLLFCEDKDEMIDAISGIDHPAMYKNEALRNFNYLDEVGQNEKADPYYFGLSLIKKIKETPKQRIGTHTFSHFYCLEPGSSLEAFEADLGAAKKIAQKNDVTLESIVFPRNQYNDAFLDVCSNMGIGTYRGNPEHFLYRPRNGAENKNFIRAARLIDSHIGFSGSQKFSPSHTRGLVNLPASHFLRPHAGTLGRFHPLHVAMIKRSMTAAAKAGRSYHLWWHPHNFGHNVDASLAVLEDIALHFLKLKDSFGFQSCSMEGASR